MKFKNTLFVVSDIKKSIEFYREVFGMRVIADFGANVTLTGGLSLQTEETWKQFIGETGEICYGGKDSEIYFEEENFDAFSAKCDSLELKKVHPAQEHSWGQRVIRLYDPDGHIIEVGEDMSAVCRRFRDSGMNIPQIASRMDVAERYVRRWLGQRDD